MDSQVSNIAPRYFSYLKSETVAPNVDELSARGRKWIAYGKDNLFPQRLRTLIDNCAPLGTCVDTLARHLAGDGFMFTENGEESDRARILFDEWMSDSSEAEFLERTAGDIATGLGKNWDLRFNSLNSLSRIDHKDVTGLRAGRMRDGKVNEYFYSYKWSNYTNPTYRPEVIAAFDKEARSHSGIETLYTKAYKQTRLYYSEPWFFGVIRDAQIWAEVANAQYRDTTTGFMPMFWLHLWGSGDDEQANDLEDAARYQFTGPEAQSCMITVGAAGVDTPPILQELDRGNISQVYNETRNKAEEVIYEGFGVPKDLVGIMPHGLTSQSESLHAKEDIFYSRLVKPLQRKFITEDMEMLFQLAGLEVEVDIKKVESFSDHINKNELMTINEHRETLGMEQIDQGNTLYGKGVSNISTSDTSGDGLE